MSDIAVVGSFSTPPNGSGSPRTLLTEQGEARDALLHIAMAQVLPDDSGLHATSRSGLSKLEDWAARAAQEGADVVVFPEYFLSGATHELWSSVRGQQSEAEQGEQAWLDVILHVARKYDVDVVAGTVVELGTKAELPHRKDGDELYNTSYYVSRGGEVHRYTKQNLWHPERATLSNSHPGSHPDQHELATFVIETKRGTKVRAAMAICWDLAWYDRFNQMLTPPFSAASDLDREGQVKGPDVIFAPTCWYASDGGSAALAWNPNAEAKLLDSLTQARAVEIEALVVMCNIAGPIFTTDQMQSLIQQIKSNPDTDLPLIGLGRSTIAAPFLGIAAQTPDANEALLLQSIDLNVLLDARQVYRMRYDHALR